MKELIQFEGAEREVIARQSDAVLPHPHPRYNGALVPFKTVNELLLDNDVRVYECAFPGVECKYVSANAASVVAHQTSHNPSRFTPDYDEETLRALIRTAKVEMRERGSRGYAERTAKILNDRGFKQLNGDPFSSTSVSRLYNRWEPEIRVRVPSGPNGERLKKPDGSPSGSLRTRLTPAELKIAEALNLTTEIKRVAVVNAEKIEKLLKEAFADAGKVAEVDPELLDKAHRWDQMQALMNGKSGK